MDIEIIDEWWLTDDEWLDLYFGPDTRSQEIKDAGIYGVN